MAIEEEAVGEIRGSMGYLPRHMLKNYLGVNPLASYSACHISKVTRRFPSCSSASLVSGAGFNRGNHRASEDLFSQDNQHVLQGWQRLLMTSLSIAYLSSLSDLNYMLPNMEGKPILHPSSLV